MARLNRRNFFATLASGVLGLGVAGRIKAEPGGTPPGQQEGSALKIKKFNPLGKTGLKVSDISCGAISLFESNVLRYAHEC